MPTCCPSRFASSRKRFTTPSILSFVQGGGHGGSHPHLVHEFVSALIEDRDPWPNAVTSANWTCVGICAARVGVERRRDRQAAGVYAVDSSCVDESSRSRNQSAGKIRSFIEGGKGPVA